MNGTKENTNELTIRDYLSSEDFLSLTVERQTEILNMLFGKYLKSDKELMAMVDPMAVHNEHYTYPKEVTDQMAKDNLELVKSDFLANAFPNKKHLFETFDPTGEGYDYETALEKGINVDSENRIMPSTVELTPEESLDIMSKSDLERCDMPEEVPISRVLIGKYNPRIREVESKLTSEGYHIIKGYDGNYYTVPSEYSYKVSGIQFQKKVEREKQLEKWDNERTQIEGDLERRIIKGLGKVKLRPITIVSKKPEEESDEGLLAILLHEGVYTGNPTLDDLREDGVTREDMIADVKGVVGDYIIPPSPAKQHWTDLPTLGEEKREPPSYVKLAFTNVATGDLDSRRRLADLRVKTYLQSDRSEDDFSDFGRQEHFLTTKEETVSCPLETCPDHDIFLEVRKLHPETSTASMSREEAIELLVKDGYETLELKEREKVLNLKNLFRYTSQAGTDEKLLDYFQRTNHSYWDLFPKDIQSEIRILYDYKDIKPRYEKEVKELYQDVAEEYQLFNEDGSINKEKIDAGLDAVMPAIEEEVKKQKEIAKHQERWLEEEAIPAKEYAKRHPYFASWEAGYLHLFGGTEKLIGDAFGWDALEKIGEKDLRRMEALTKTRPGDEKGVTGLMAEGNWKQAFDLSYRQALQSAPITSVAMIAHLSGHPYIGFGLMMPGTTGARKYELDRFYKDLPEGIKWANAFIHGIGEAGSEMLGATAGIDGGKQILMKMGKTTFIKKGVLSTMKNIAKKGAAVATVHAYEMAVEGLEEGANQFWTNLADNIMGLKNDWKLGEGVWEAIVSGTMSAGFFEGSTITGYTLLDAKGRAIPFTIELKETGDKYKVVWDSGVSLDMINPKKGKFSVRGVDNEIYEFNKKDVKIKLSELSRKRAGKRLSENLSLAEEGTLKYKVSLEGVGDHYRLLHGAEKGSKKFAKELGEIAIKVRKNIASGNLDDLMDAKKLLDEMWIRNKRGVLDNYLTEEDKQKVKQEWKELNAQYIKVIDQREGKPLYYLDGKEYKNKDDFFKDAFSSITKAIDEGSTTKIAVENDDETLKVINNFIYNKKVIKEQKIKKEAEKAKEELSKKEKEIEGRRQEELKDITDTKKIEEINAKYDKELAALKKEPVKTTEEKAEVSEGKKVKVYRGTGGGVKSRGLKVLGSGKYFFTNKASAKIYGEEIDETEVSTDDLLVIDGNNYKEIAADVGVDIDGLSSKESVAKLGEIGKKIEEYAKKKGYKGVYAIDNVKDVDNGWHRFIGIEGADGTQIVVFEETKKEKQPAKELTKEQEKKKRGFFIGAHKKERFIREKLGLKGKENKPVFDKLIRAYKKHVTDKESMSDMTLEEAENYSNALIKSTDAINWIEKNRKTILETEVLEEEKEPVTSKLKDMYEIAEEGEGSLDYYMGTLESKDLKFIINTMIEENIVDDSFVKDLEDKNILRDGKFNLVGKVDKITKKEYLRREISKQFLKEFPTKKEKIEKKPKKSILEKDITKLDYSTEFRANPHLFTKEEWVGEYVRREGEDKRNTAEKLHKKGVEKALKGGKTIDDNVKADYPGLFKEKKAESRIEQPERTPVIGIGDLHGEDPNTLNEDLEANEITKDGEWDTDKTILIKPPPEILRKETTEVDNIIEIGEPQNIRGKRSDGNWIVSYKIKLKKGQKGVGGKDYFEKDKMFWKKEDAEKWIAENKVEKKKDQDYIMADEEIEKAIKASPTKDKNEFVRESINDFSFLLELNDEMDFQEFAEGIKKYADLGDLKNRVTYNAIRRSKGVVKRTPDKGINISIESVLEPTDVQKIKTDLPNKIAADILVDLKQYINPENKESDVSGLVSKDLEMKFTKRVAPLAESNPELYNELVAKKDVILKEAEQIAKDDIRKQFEGISKKKEEKKIAKRSPESPDEQREKGWKEGKDGEKIYRRKVIKNKKGEKKRKLVGKIKSLLFAKKVQPEGNLVIVEVEDIVPSHKHIGQEKLIRNIDNFIPEAQPKEREDDIVSAIEILETIQPNMWDPKKLSHLTETAYTGVISVNTRGEVIQGNNRAEFIRMAYKMFNNSSGAKYKAYLIEHADELGIDAEEIKKMKRPALVNMLDVSDGKAIELGNYTALDIETGGKQKMIPQNIVQKSRKTKGMLKNIVDMITHIGEGMEELSFRKIVKYNAEDALHYLLEKELITKDQYSTALEKGHITKEAIDVLEQVVTSGLMIGAPTGFMEKLRALPKDVQNVLTPIMPFLGEEENDWNIIKDVQDAVIGTYLFLDTTGGRTIVERRGDFTSWLDQIVIGEKVTPRERYSNFTLSLIREFAVNRYSAKWSDVMIGAITSYHDLVTTPDLFHKTPDSKKGALLKIFGVEETDEWLKMFPRNIRSITQIYKTSDVRFREALSIEIPQLSEAAKKRLIRLNKSIFGDDWIRIVPEISENRKALGKYHDGWIDIVENRANPKDTFLHEAVHKAEDLFLTEEEKAELEKAMPGREKRAEDIINYQNGTKTFRGKVKRIIDKLLRVLRRLFGKTRNIDKVHDFYDRLMSGYYAQQKVPTTKLQPAMFSAPDVFYSKLARTVDNKFPTQMKAQSIPNWLKKQQVKPAEMDWMGLDEFLKGKDKVTIQEMQEFVAMNSLTLEEFILKEIPEEDIDTLLDDEIGEMMTREEAREYLKSDQESGYVKFSDYQLQGGTNYKEYFVTAPFNNLFEQKRFDYLDKKITELETKLGKKGISNVERTKITKEIESLMPEWKKYRWGIGKKIWEDGHSAYSDIENPVVRIRTNDRVLTDGRKFLHVEEMQPPKKEEMEKMPKFLKENAYEIGVKKVLQMAVAGGYDGISWTTGKQQADRYDLSKQIDELEVSKNDKGLYAIYAEKDGDRVIITGSLSENTLADYIGKELAGKAINDLENNKRKHYSGIDLKVGGEYIKSIYDKTIPNIIKKYTKKWKGKIGSIEIELAKDKKTGYKVKQYNEDIWQVVDSNNKRIQNFDSKKKAEEYISRFEQKASTQPSLTITPEMRESIPMGQELFRRDDTALIEEAKKYKSAEEFVKAQTELTPIEEIASKFKSAEDFIAHYRGSATQYNDYTPELRKFGTTEQSERISNLGIDPNRKVTIYRGIDIVDGKGGNKINNGDFVTTDYESAKSYTGGKVIAKEVTAKDLITDFPEEFDAKDPFFVGAEFIYSHSKNKLIKYTDSDLADIYNKAKSRGTKTSLSEIEKQLAFLQKKGKIPPRVISGFGSSPEYGKYGTTERQQTSAYYEFISNKKDELIKTKAQLTDIWNKAQGKGEVDLTEEAKKYKSAEEFVKAQGTPVYHGSPNKIIGELKSSKELGTSQHSSKFGGVFFSEDKAVAGAYSKLPNRTNLSQIKRPEVLNYVDRLQKKITEYNNTVDKLYQGFDKQGWIVDNDFERYVSAERGGKPIKDKIAKIQNEIRDIKKTAPDLTDTEKSLLYGNANTQEVVLVGDVVDINKRVGFSENREALIEKYKGKIIKLKDGNNQGEYIATDPSQIKTKSQLIDIWNKANKVVSQTSLFKTPTEKLHHERNKLDDASKVSTHLSGVSKAQKERVAWLDKVLKNPLDPGIWDKIVEKFNRFSRKETIKYRRKLLHKPLIDKLVLESKDFQSFEEQYNKKFPNNWIPKNLGYSVESYYDKLKHGKERISDIQSKSIKLKEKQQEKLRDIAKRAREIEHEEWKVREKLRDDIAREFLELFKERAEVILNNVPDNVTFSGFMVYYKQYLDAWQSFLAEERERNIEEIKKQEGKKEKFPTTNYFSYKESERGKWYPTTRVAKILKTEILPKLPFQEYQKDFIKRFVPPVSLFNRIYEGPGALLITQGNHDTATIQAVANATHLNQEEIPDPTTVLIGRARNAMIALQAKYGWKPNENANRRSKDYLDQEQDLIRKYLNEGDIDARNTLLLYNLDYLIKAIMSQYRGNAARLGIAKGLEGESLEKFIQDLMEDVISEGFEGFWQGLKKYDVKKGGKVFDVAYGSTRNAIVSLFDMGAPSFVHIGQTLRLQPNAVKKGSRILVDEDTGKIIKLEEKLDVTEGRFVGLGEEKPAKGKKKIYIELIDGTLVGVNRSHIVGIHKGVIFGDALQAIQPSETNPASLLEVKDINEKVKRYLESIKDSEPIKHFVIKSWVGLIKDGYVLNVDPIYQKIANDYNNKFPHLKKVGRNNIEAYVKDFIKGVQTSTYFDGPKSETPQAVLFKLDYAGQSQMVLKKLLEVAQKYQNPYSNLMGTLLMEDYGTVESSLVDDFISGKGIDLIGKSLPIRGSKALRADDLALLSQIFRSYSIEKSWLVFINKKTGEIVDVTGTTSNLPMATRYFDEKTFSAFKNNLKKKIKKLGPNTEIIHIHNHTTDMVNPSIDDHMNFTKMIDNIPQITEAIILNENKYTRMYRNNEGNVVWGTRKLDKAPKLYDEKKLTGTGLVGLNLKVKEKEWSNLGEREKSKAHKLFIETIVSYVKTNDNYFHILGVKADNNIHSIIRVKRGLLKDKTYDDAKKMLKDIARKHGASGLIMVYPVNKNSTPGREGMSVIEKLITDKIVSDAIIYDENSVYSFVAKPKTNSIGEPLYGQFEVKNMWRESKAINVFRNDPTFSKVLAEKSMATIKKFYELSEEEYERFNEFVSGEEIIGIYRAIIRGDITDANRRWGKCQEKIQKGLSSEQLHELLVASWTRKYNVSEDEINKIIKKITKGKKTEIFDLSAKERDEFIKKLLAIGIREKGLSESDRALIQLDIERRLPSEVELGSKDKPKTDAKLTEKDKEGLKKSIEKEIEKYSIESKKGVKVNLNYLTIRNRWLYDLIDVAGLIEDTTHINGLFSAGKGVEVGVHIYTHINYEGINEFDKKFGKIYDKGISIKINDAIIYFLDTGKVNEVLSNKENRDYLKMARWLKKFNDERIRPLVKKNRVKQYYQGKLKDEHFTEDQLKILEKWKDKLGEFEGNFEKYYKLFDEIEKGKLKEFDIFGRENYISKEAPFRELVADRLMENYDKLTVSGRHLRKRKWDKKKGKEMVKADVVQQVFRNMRINLRIEHILDPAEEFWKIIRDNNVFGDEYAGKDYKNIKEQLLTALGKVQYPSEIDRAIRNAQGAIYSLGVALKFKLQVKNIFQRFLNYETLVDLKYTFTGKNALINRYGTKIHDRIRKEMIQREGIRRLYGMGSHDKLRGRSAFFGPKRNRVAGYVNAFFNNPAVRLQRQFPGRLACDLQVYMDTLNRLNGMYTWMRKAEIALNKKNWSWKKKKKYMTFTTLEGYERLYLEKILDKHGEGEFMYQLAKMKTTKAQFEYTPALRSMMTSKQGTVIKLALEYSTWWRGYNKLMRQRTRHLIRKGDTLGAFQSIATTHILGMVTKTFLAMLFGQLPKKRDPDETFLETVWRCGLDYWSPVTYGGSWTISTLLGPIDLYAVKNMIKGVTYGNDIITQSFTGLTGTVIWDITVAHIFLITTLWWTASGDKDKTIRELRKLLDKVEQPTSTLLVPMRLATNYFESTGGKRHLKALRGIANSLGIEDINNDNAIEQERAINQQLSHFVFGGNPPYQKTSLEEFIESLFPKKEGYKFLSE